MRCNPVSWFLKRFRYQQTAIGRRRYIKDNTDYVGLLFEIPLYIILSPFIVGCLIYVVIRWLLILIGSLVCAYCEAFKEAWEGRQ
jgi:hypothetical protein